MDYEALAKQFGGSAAPAPATDYAAIAKQFGGETSSSNGMPGERSTPMSEVGAGFVKILCLALSKWVRVLFKV